jgi:hypothetical protein
MSSIELAEQCGAYASRIMQLERELAAATGEYRAAVKALDSAIEALRDIAAMKTVSKRQRINSERAVTWLTAHGYPLEAGGYVPGVGFKEEIDT